MQPVDFVLPVRLTFFRETLEIQLPSIFLAKGQPRSYVCIVEFEWDPAKSDRCFAERGFDFAYVIRAFFDPDRLIQKDKRYAYGETRYQLLGKIETRIFVVAYTLRHEAIRIISARKANTREVRHYEHTTRDC